MSELVSRGNGLFFECKRTETEKKTAEYRKRVRDLEERVSVLEENLALAMSLINDLKGGSQDA